MTQHGLPADVRVERLILRHLANGAVVTGRHLRRRMRSTDREYVMPVLDAMYERGVIDINLDTGECWIRPAATR